jgi:hypothetical protein
VDETQYQVLKDELKGISRHLDEIKRDNRQRQRAEKELWAELLAAINSVEMALGH